MRKKGSPKSHLNLPYTYIELYILEDLKNNIYNIIYVLYLIRHACVLSHVLLWTSACQAPLSMEFPRQKYWTGLPFPPPGDLSNPGTEPTSLEVVGNLLPLSNQGILKTWKWYLNMLKLHILLAHHSFSYLIIL